MSQIMRCCAWLSHDSLPPGPVNNIYDRSKLSPSTASRRTGVLYRSSKAGCRFGNSVIVLDAAGGYTTLVGYTAASILCSAIERHVTKAGHKLHFLALRAC